MEFWHRGNPPRRSRCVRRKEEEKGEGEGLDGGVGGSSLVQVKVALPATHYPAAKLPTPRFGVTTPSKHGNQTLASTDTLRFDLFLMKS